MRLHAWIAAWLGVCLSASSPAEAPLIYELFEGDAQGKI